MVAFHARHTDSADRISNSTALSASGDSRRDPGGPPEETEAYEELLSRAGRKTGDIPAPLLVKHVLSVSRDADWPVQREAMDALLRRLSFARRDELVIASRPPRRAVFGLYTTRRRGSSTRPYRTFLESVDPPRGSCDCPDFLRSSLGLCKHLLAVLGDIASKPRRLARARREGAFVAPAPRLTWDPVRPLRGPGDLLAQVRWVGGRDLDRGSNGAGSKARRWFRSDGEGNLLLRNTCADRPARRLELVRDLLSLTLRRRGARGTAPLDPALLTLLEDERQRLERVLELGIHRRSLRAALRGLKQRLYPYQLAGVERFLSDGRLLLADDMGLGKTAQAIASCHVLWMLGKARRGLLIVPASLKPQWQREWQLFTDVPVAIVDGGPAERQRAFRSTKRGFLVINYEQVLRDLEFIHRWKPEIIVLDEAQRIKNWATKTAAYVKTLRSPYRLVLTGTPMENRLDELASILDWVDDFALEPKWRLVPWHTTPVNGGKDIGGARHLDTLRSRLSGCMTRRIRKDVLSQLPPRTDTRLPVELTSEQLEEHHALDQPIASILRRARKRPLTQAEFLKLMSLLTAQRIISNGLAQLRFETVWPEISRHQRPSEELLKGLSSPKLEELRELVRRVVVDQGRKAVIFSQWLRMLRLAHWAVGDILADAGRRGVFFTGKESQKRRTHNIVDFHDDPDTAILFASDAGGVGLNLQRAANACINLELPWNPAVLEQRIGRVYRLGQKRPIDVYNLVSEVGIEARIADIVATKKALFSSLFDGGSDCVNFERSSSFLSRLEMLIEPVKVPEIQEDTEEEVDEGGAGEREVDEILAAADESRDPVAAESGTGEPAAELKGQREPGREVGGARRDVAAAADITRLFSGLEIRRRRDGGMRIEAKPEAASALAAVFDGMARLLKQAGGE